MNNKVNEFYPSFVFFLNMVLLWNTWKNMEEGDFFRIEFLNTILFLKTIKNYFKIYNQTCLKNLNRFTQ